MLRETRLILCPINLRHSEIAYGAYDEAVEMARRRGARLLVMTVAPEMERNLNITDSEAYWGVRLKEFLAAHPVKDVELEAVVRKGAVHRQILKLTKERNVDLIVMESSNPKVQDYLLGTTASHVVAYARCSVYVVRK